MMNMPEGETRPPTALELLDRVAPVQSIQATVHSELKASALCCPLSVAPGKVSMTDEEKARARIDAIKNIRHT